MGLTQNKKLMRYIDISNVRTCFTENTLSPGLVKYDKVENIYFSGMARVHKDALNGKTLKALNSRE